MYGLPQVGILANKLRKEQPANYGYFELPHMPGPFNHEPWPVWFTLVVDNFRIKHIVKENVLHLISALKKYHDVEENWAGSLYYRMSLDWHY